MSFINFFFNTTLVVFSTTIFCQSDISHLVKKGSKTQLIVDGKPFTILGGELGNSSATTMEYMKPIWPKLKDMNLNTVLMPVYWELIEPQESKFDFKLYENLITEARNNKLKVVILWFGAWKNSISSHAPSWVKRNQSRFPRVKDDKGVSQEILSCFNDEVLNADIKAYTALLQFVKDYDASYNTVIMVQVENEIGMLPTARDHQNIANQRYKEQIPRQLIKYLQDNKLNLVPELAKLWQSNGWRTSGSWEEIFGAGVQTEEIFMAYYYGIFANKLSAEGKKIYPLPIFVNAALNRPGREPGTYPSGGPLPHLIDVWKASGNDVDFLAPDFYNPDFKHWCDLYTRQGDPLFVPEHIFDNTVACKAIYTVGHYQGLGFSPFSIESVDKPSENPLAMAYSMINQLKSLLDKHWGSEQIDAVMVTKAIPETIIRMGKYEMSCKHDYTLSWNPGSKTDDWPLASAMIIQTGENEFYIAGNGIVITFKDRFDKTNNIGLLKVDEGRFIDGQWKVLRHMNGDQTHQGRHINVEHNQFTIQRVELYDYK